MRFTDSSPIIVGIDFDAASAHALREALRIAASRPGVTVHVLHAAPDGAKRRGGALRRAAATLEEVPARLRQWVTDELAGFDDSVDLAVVAHARFGDPAAALVQLAVDLDADLVIVGSHGRRGARRMLLGSVAERTVRLACCPVLVAHPKTFAGLVRSPEMEPLCADCARVRAETGSARLWCTEHASHRTPAHVPWSSETLAIGRHNASVLPPS